MFPITTRRFRACDDNPNVVAPDPALLVRGRLHVIVALKPVRIEQRDLLSREQGADLRGVLALTPRLLPLLYRCFESSKSYDRRGVEPCSMRFGGGCGSSLPGLPEGTADSIEAVRGLTPSPGAAGATD